jgi:hypothetical protein
VARVRWIEGLGSRFNNNSLNRYNMSNMTLRLAINRIKSSETPLAVFVSEKPDYINVVFSDTVISQQKIKANDPMLIGVFNRDTPVSELESILRQHVSLAALRPNARQSAPGARKT